jgi:hypothetical protein
MQMMVLPNSGGLPPVAPMLFTSQLTLSFTITVAVDNGSWCFF